MSRGPGAAAPAREDNLAPDTRLVMLAIHEVLRTLIEGEAPDCPLQPRWGPLPPTADALRPGSRNAFDLAYHFEMQLDRNRMPGNGTELLTVLGGKRLLNEVRKRPELDAIPATRHDFVDGRPHGIVLPLRYARAFPTGCRSLAQDPGLVGGHGLLPLRWNVWQLVLPSSATT